MLIDRLTVDKPLRRLCGWEHRGELPSETTFSRAFAEFARSALPCRVHEALIKQAYKDRLVGHISRDATAIEAREKPVKSAPPAASTPVRPKRKRGRPRPQPVEFANRVGRNASLHVRRAKNGKPDACGKNPPRTEEGG